MTYTLTITPTPEFIWYIKSLTAIYIVSTILCYLIERRTKLKVSYKWLPGYNLVFVASVIVGCIHLIITKPNE